MQTPCLRMSLPTPLPACCLLQTNCCLLQRVCVEALARLYHREAEDATAQRQPTQTIQVARERAGKMWETLALAPAPPEEKALPIEQRRDWLRDARAEVGGGWCETLRGPCCASRGTSVHRAAQGLAAGGVHRGGVCKVTPRKCLPSVQGAAPNTAESCATLLGRGAKPLMRHFRTRPQ